MKNKDEEKILTRHDQLRRAMAERDEELWIIAGSEASDLKGYVRYISDWHIVDGIMYVLIPLHGYPSVIVKLGSQAYWVQKKCKIPDVHPAFDVTDKLIELLRDTGLQNTRIGVVGLEDVIPYLPGRRLVSAFPNIEFTEATEEMNRIMIPSTEEDFACAEEAQKLLEGVMRRFGEELKVGRSERFVVAGCIQEMEELGCTDGACRISLDHSGSNRLPTERCFDEEDIVRLYLEACGPSGYWAEMGGVFSFKEPPPQVYRKFETTIKAMDAVRARMLPGAYAGDLCAAGEQVFQDDGWEIIGRALWDAHGQGMCKHLPPFAWPGSKQVLKENMILNQHPGTRTSDGYGFSLTSNFVVSEDGGRPLGDFHHVWHLV